MPRKAWRKYAVVVGILFVIVAAAFVVNSIPPVKARLNKWWGTEPVVYPQYPVQDPEGLKQYYAKKKQDKEAELKAEVEALQKKIATLKQQNDDLRKQLGQ